MCIRDSPFGNFESPTQIPPMLLNTVRAEILRDVLCRVGLRWPMVQNSPYLEPYCFAFGADGVALYLINASTDTVEHIHLTDAPVGPITVWRSEDGGHSQQVFARRVKNGAMIDLSVNSMETVLLAWQSEKEGDRK